MILDGKHECDWESQENIKATRYRVELLFKGCSCSSVTACSTRRCSCVKKCTKCGPGCRCKNCGNTTSHPYAQHHLEEIVVEELLEVEQEELLHDEILREEYREGSVDCDSEEDNNDLDGDVIDEYEEVNEL